MPGPDAARSVPADGRTMDYADVSSTFVRLADTHLVQRCPLLPDAPQGPAAPPAPAPTLVLNEKDMYAVPRLNLTGERAPRGAREAQHRRAPTPRGFFLGGKQTPLSFFVFFFGRAGKAAAVVRRGGGRRARGKEAEAGCGGHRGTGGGLEPRSSLGSGGGPRVRAPGSELEGAGVPAPSEPRPLAGAGTAAAVLRTLCWPCPRSPRPTTASTGK